MNTSLAKPWWRTAPNPPCASWCTREHAANEFGRNNGSLLCTRVITSSPSFAVEVQLCTATDEHDTPGFYERDAMSIWWWTSGSLDDAGPEPVEPFATALLEAAEFIRKQAEA